MIVLTALAVLLCSTSATVHCKARPFMTTAPACGPNLKKRVQQASLGVGTQDAYSQLSELVMASPDKGQSGEDKLLANFKKAFAYAPAVVEDVVQPDGKLELTAMLTELKDLGWDADKFAAEMFEQIQEVNHLSLQIFEMNGKPVPHGIKRAEAGAKHCPDVYQASRDAGFEIAQTLDLKETLGVNPDVCEIMVPGMPPFYAGDKTKGHEYFPVENAVKVDFGLAMSQGNQYSDGGLHVSVYNRRDAAGLVLTDQCYMVPGVGASRALVEKADTYEFTIDADRVKLVQGQARNDHNVGGACYIGMETDKNAIAFVHKIQTDVMPSGFRVDASQQLHVSIAALGPKGIPHYKSPWALEQMAQMDNDQRIAFRKAHANTYVELRKKMDVDHLTHWGKYEEAAALIPKPAKFGGLGMAYLLVDVLGFKTSVVSPKIATAEQLAGGVPLNADNDDVVLPRTMWNGNWVSEEVREEPFCYDAKSIKEWIKDWAPTGADGTSHPTKYVNDASQNSLRASVSAEAYYNAVEASYAGEEAAETQRIIDSLMSTIPERVVEVIQTLEVVPASGGDALVETTVVTEPASGRGVVMQTIIDWLPCPRRSQAAQPLVQ